MGTTNLDVLAANQFVGPSQKPVVLLSADGAIAIPLGDTVYVITKGSAAALTLANPAASADGVELTIYSETAFAHVITCPLGFNNKGSSGTATWAAAAANGVQLVARNGKWWVVPGGNTNVTLA